MPKHAVLNFRLWADVGDYRFDDVVSVTANFKLNTIPTATIDVAVGADVRNQSKVATIHRAIGALNVDVPVQIYLRPEATSIEDLDPGMEVFVERAGDNGFLIFDGKVAGTSWVRSTNSVNFQIHVIHWLSHLNYSSAVSATTHPGNQADLAFRATVFRDGNPDAAAGVGAQAPRFIVPGVDQSFISSANLSDLWGNILHPWLKNLASRDLAGDDVPADGDIIASVNRMGPNNDGAPLAVRGVDADQALVKSGISDMLRNIAGSNWVNTTLWGKLVGELAPAFMFSVVPRITDALIVPFTGGLQGDPFQTITVDDYVHCNINSQTNQVLKQINIAYPATYSTVTDHGKGGLRLSSSDFIGSFPPPNFSDQVEHGLELIKDAPPWLAKSGITATPPKDVQPVGNSLDPITEPDANAANLRNQRRSQQLRLRSIADRYAQQWFALESTKGRIGEISGKLRFDIAPGSELEIETGGAKNIAAVPAPLRKIRAVAMGVSYVLNAESQQASTVLQLSHIRSSAENQSLKTSTPSAPLYDAEAGRDPWRGASLSSEIT